MTCPIDIGDTFVWQEDYKDARKGDTVDIDSIYVDEDGIPQVTVINYRDASELVTAEDIHNRVEEGRLERQ